MKTPTYSDIMIGSLDKQYIDRIADETGIDETQAPLYSLESERPCIANDIIYYIISEAVQALDISQESKDILNDRIYTNCIDSGFINTDLDAFPESEHPVIQSIMEIF